MKKKYMLPVVEVTKLNMTNSLLVGSLLDVNDEANIIDDGQIVDIEGTFDPEGREFNFDM